MWSNGLEIDVDGANAAVCGLAVGEVAYGSGGDLQEIVVDGYFKSFEVMVELMGEEWGFVM